MKKEIAITLKSKSEILSDLRNVTEGSEIVLLFNNGEVYEGLFVGLEEEDECCENEEVLLKRPGKTRIIGLPVNRLMGTKVVKRV